MNTLYPRGEHRDLGLAPIRIAATIVVGLFISGCGSGDPSSPRIRSEASLASNPDKVSVCHVEGVTPSIVEVSASALRAHLAHGDYLAELDVDDLGPTGDGIHFRRITDALAAARTGRLERGELETAGCRITIVVAGGIRPGSTKPSSDPSFEQFPLIIDVPDITLRGAMQMQVDAAGRASGVSATGVATTFAPSPALTIVGAANLTERVSEVTVLVNGHPGGSKGDGAIIEGFVFQSGHAASDPVLGGQGLMSMRVRNLVVRGNTFETGFTETVNLRASSALVERNQLSGQGLSCDICLAGPGQFVVRDNRLLGPGGLPGVLILPLASLPIPAMVEPYSLPPEALVIAEVTNNEVRGHLRTPSGVGIRVGAVGPGAANVIGSSQVTLTGNTLVSNTFGVMVEAAFPVAGSALRGDVAVTTSGNTFVESCQSDLVVSFTRHASGLGLPSPNPSYLRNSTYTLALGADLPWERAWFSNPEGLGNTLIVNGEVMANGIHHAYDANRVCAP